MRGRGFGLPPRACVAYVNVLVGFMSEKVTDTAFAQYVLRWQRWHWGGLDGIVSRKGGAERSWQHVLTHLELQRPS